MNGSTVSQFLYQGYHNNLAVVVTNYATTILGAMAALVQAIIMICIIVFGYKMMANALAWEAGLTRMTRLIIVASLMTAANYTTFVATPVTTTIPDFISNTVTGSHGLQGAQGYDALINQVDNASARARAQMVGYIYIGDRAVLWIVGALAKIIIICCLFLWALANSAADILVPLGAIIIPFYLFDATRGFTERWYAKITALFIVMTLGLMLGQIVVYQDAQYIQRYTTALAAAPPDNGFLNIDPGAGELMFPPVTPGGVEGPTMNTDGAIDTMVDATLVFLFGLFLLVVVTGIGLGIGMSSGFTAAPAFSAVTAGLSKVARSRR